MAILSQSSLASPVKNGPNYQEYRRFMRWLNKSLWSNTGFPWPLISLELAGVAESLEAGLPLGRFARGNPSLPQRYSAGDCVLFSVALAG